MSLPHDLTRIALIGIGATALMDLWLVLLRRLGVPTGRIDHIGRWAGHLLRGRVVHDAIARATPIPGELAWGWLVHYAVGIGFAGLLVALQGLAWTTRPTLAPALVFGLASVVAPLGVMQPAMGAGFAASKTPTPLKNSLRSVVNHAVFGLGLYLTAHALAAWPPAGA